MKLYEVVYLNCERTVCVVQVYAESEDAAIARVRYEANETITVQSVARAD